MREPAVFREKGLPDELAVEHPKQADIDMLRGLGVHPLYLAGDWLDRTSILYTAWVHFLPGGRFFDPASPDEEGAVRAYVSLVRNQLGEKADVVAFDLTRFALLEGRVCVLGAENAFRPRIEPELIVFDTPVSWLAAGRSGIVVCDYLRAAEFLRDAGPLIASAPVGRRLREAEAERALQIYVEVPPSTRAA